MEFYSALKKNEIITRTHTHTEGVGVGLWEEEEVERDGKLGRREREGKGMYVAWCSNFLQTATFLSGTRVVVGGPGDPSSGSYKYQGPFSQL